MSDPTRYAYVLTPRDDGQLHEEIAALNLPGFLGICGSGANVEALFSADLSTGDKATLDAAVAAHVPDPDRLTKLARAAAKALLNRTEDELADVLRAIVALTVNKVNNPIAARMAAQDGVIAASGGLPAAFKTAWAGASTANPVPSYTLGLARTALENALDAGDADS